MKNKQKILALIIVGVMVGGNIISSSFNMDSDQINLEIITQWDNIAFREETTFTNVSLTVLNPELSECYLHLSLQQELELIPTMIIMNMSVYNLLDLNKPDFYKNILKKNNDNPNQLQGTVKIKPKKNGLNYYIEIYILFTPLAVIGAYNLSLVCVE